MLCVVHTVEMTALALAPLMTTFNTESLKSKCLSLCPATSSVGVRVKMGQGPILSPVL